MTHRFRTAAIILVVILTMAGFALIVRQQLSNQASQPAANALEMDEESVAGAKGAVIDFLTALHDKRYAEAETFYGSDYGLLWNWNPTVESSDHAALWKNGCEMNGLVCLEIRNLAVAEHPDAKTYVVNVWLSNADKTEFTTEFGQTMFPFTVAKLDNGKFEVQTMPPYQE